MSVLDVLVPFTCRDCGYVLRVPLKDWNKMVGEDPAIGCPSCSQGGEP